jgi:sporulation and spore germination protein
MMQRVFGIIGLGLITGGLAWLIFAGLPKWYSGPRQPAMVASAAPVPSAPPGRKIRARLFYVADDGASLVGVEREIPYGEGAIAQAKEIITAQLAPVTDPLVSAIPMGTKLQALFITNTGEAFVDVSPEIMFAHPGGSLNEMLTIYTLVDALTANMPAVTSVQLLVNGKEVETLAGHVDLRRPLARNLEWVEEPAPAPAAPDAPAPPTAEPARPTQTP